MKITDLPDSEIRRDLLERIPVHQHDWEFTPTELFDEWLQWHGIIGWTGAILKTIKIIKESEK